MKFKKPSSRHMLSSCNELGSEDGADPRIFFRKSSHKRGNRKALQMCGEIARTVSAILAWESGDDLLRGLIVEAVEPAPDSRRVLVSVSFESSAAPVDLAQVLERLHRISGRLRTEVAAAIHRKRAPELVFRVSGRGEVSP